MMTEPAHTQPGCQMRVQNHSHYNPHKLHFAMTRIEETEDVPVDLTMFDLGDTLMDPARIPGSVGHPAFDFSFETDREMGIHVVSVTFTSVIGAMLYFQHILEMVVAVPLHFEENDDAVLCQGIRRLATLCRQRRTGSYTTNNSGDVWLLNECMEIAAGS